MTSRQIRRQFLDFFASKAHKIIPSAPIVAKSDPTLLFINSGMAPDGARPAFCGDVCCAPFPGDGVPGICGSRQSNDQRVIGL